MNEKPRLDAKQSIENNLHFLILWQIFIYFLRLNKIRIKTKTIHDRIFRIKILLNKKPHRHNRLHIF